MVQPLLNQGHLQQAAMSRKLLKISRERDSTLQLCHTRAEQRGRVISLDLGNGIPLAMILVDDGLLCHKDMLLAQGQLVDQQDSQVFFCKADFQPVVPQCVLGHRVISPQMKNLSRPFVEFHEELSPFLHTAEWC